MYWITSEALVEKFRTGTFQTEEVEPYFMASAVVGGLGFIGLGSQVTVWDYLAGIAMLCITIGGVLHLKRQNGGTFAGQYLERYFALGWVTGVRLLLVGIPAAVILFGIAAAAGGEGAVYPISAAYFTAITFAWYWYTGILFEESQATTEERDPQG